MNVASQSKSQKWLKFRKEFLSGKKNFEGYYTCEHCGRWVEYIEVDHIIKRSIAPDRVFDHTNLRALCSVCHRDVNPDYKKPR